MSQHRSHHVQQQPHVQYAAHTEIIHQQPGQYPQYQTGSKHSQTQYTSIMKKSQSPHPVIPYKADDEPVISPPEGFQSDPIPLMAEQGMNDLNQAEEREFYQDLQRRLQAKAAQYEVRPPVTKSKSQDHEKSGKTKSHHHKIRSSTTGTTNYIVSDSPLINTDDSYELCVASDAELHTLGLDHGRHHGQQTTQNYFSLPHTHGHHRPASASPRNVQTLMRPPQNLYRRPDDYAFNYTA